MKTWIGVACVLAVCAGGPAFAQTTTSTATPTTTGSPTAQVPEMNANGFSSSEVDAIARFYKDQAQKAGQTAGLTGEEEEVKKVYRYDQGKLTQGQFYGMPIPQRLFNNIDYPY